jgi:hypothetical protein
MVISSSFELDHWVVLFLMPKLNSSTGLEAQKVILDSITTYIEWIFISLDYLLIFIESDLIEYHRNGKNTRKNVIKRAAPSSRKKETEWASNQPNLLYLFNVVFSNLLDVAKGCETNEGSIALDKLEAL